MSVKKEYFGDKVTNGIGNLIGKIKNKNIENEDN